ncbi:hypothetical protein E5Q_03576 [Mixia osmundae IAM 14324]|uniref:Uncharacterized protein n=1 Tax=Mixia osmundae (strain CBS 9802 / IAM 14324 / JCM 22182 / KY 12970) TaxID=764103 RepID=G7E243_MIXOS|nr:hypothetical protein E5Q_03576 [Mixia osmundae IAM 14324]
MPASATRRETTKLVLDDPLRPQWPTLSVAVKNQALQALLSLLTGIAAPRQELHRHRRSRKRERVGIDVELHGPKLLNELIVGLNACSAHLERSIARLRRPKALPSPYNDPQDLNLLLVCQDDLNPASLAAHLPGLIAVYNGLLECKHDGGMLLVPLPAGAESKLSCALGLRRVAAIAIKASCSEARDLMALLRTHVEPVRCTWLDPPAHQNRMQPLRLVKQVTAHPSSGKASRAQRIAIKRARRH